MKRILLLALAILLSGCFQSKNETPSDEVSIAADKAKTAQKKIRETEERIRNLNEQLHICDNNGGIIEIKYFRGNWDRDEITCKNGLMKEFKR